MSVASSLALIQVSQTTMWLHGLRYIALGPKLV